jgi:hypothetical protein
MKQPNLSNFGKKLKFSERVEKNKTVTEQEIFVETMDMFSELWDRSNSTYDKHKINLLEYEEQFYQVIEGFVLLNYGLLQTEIILWYVFARKNEEGEIADLVYKVKEEKEERIKINNATELWELLKRIEKDSNTEEE